MTTPDVAGALAVLRTMPECAHSEKVNRVIALLQPEPSGEDADYAVVCLDSLCDRAMVNENHRAAAHQYLATIRRVLESVKESA